MSDAVLRQLEREAQEGALDPIKALVELDRRGLLSRGRELSARAPRSARARLAGSYFWRRRRQWAPVAVGVYRVVAGMRRGIYRLIRLDATTQEPVLSEPTVFAAEINGNASVPMGQHVIVTGQPGSLIFFCPLGVREGV